eukprot:2363644-Pyramimonas_sp.AAC.1
MIKAFGGILGVIIPPGCPPTRTHIELKPPPAMLQSDDLIDELALERTRSTSTGGGRLSEGGAGEGEGRRLGGRAATAAPVAGVVAVAKGKGAEGGEEAPAAGDAAATGEGARNEPSLLQSDLRSKAERTPLMTG